MLVRRTSAWSVEMLAVLVVLTLVPTWSDGLLLTKCELKSQLEAALSNLQIIAKLACTVENISGFNTSLVTNTDPVKPGTLIIAPFLYVNDEDYSSGMGELPLTTETVSNNDVFPESMEGTEEPSTLQAEGEDKFTPGQDKEIVGVDAHPRKRREAPSEDEGNGSGAGFSGNGDILQTTVEPNRLPDSTDGDETYEMQFGPTYFPPESIYEHGDMMYYDTYEMLFGPTDLPPDSITEPKDPLDLSTTGALEPETNERSKHSSEDPTQLYGIFQLSDITCNSGSSYSLDICQLNCSALTDDDITDDIACLMILIETMMSMTFPQECLAVEPSDYFAECG